MLTKDVQVVSDSANDENTDGTPEDLNVPVKTDDDQPVDLSIPYVKECKMKIYVDFSFRNVNVTDQVVSVDD